MTPVCILHSAWYNTVSHFVISTEMPRRLGCNALTLVQIQDSGYIQSVFSLDPVENETNVRPFGTSVGRLCWRNQLFTHAQSITVGCGRSVACHRFLAQMAPRALIPFQSFSKSEIWMGDVSYLISQQSASF